jgi:surfactin synthase thioesterase subunit
MAEDTGAGIRLFCFAHAGGGGTFFLPWRTRLGPDIAVCPVVLPGREGRIGERPFTRMDDLVPPLVEALRPHIDRPFAFFGHSMGAAVAYEVTRRLSAEGTGLPLCLFVSARCAPQERVSPSLHGMSETETLAAVRKLSGAPEEVLRRRDWRDRFLPCLLADFELNDTYLAAPGGRLACPVSAMTGDADPVVTPADMRSWRETTHGTFGLRVFGGDHFYLKGPPRALVAAIQGDLRRGVVVPHQEAGR